MLTGGAPPQLSSLYRTQLTFSKSQTAVEGQTSCFSFLCNAYLRIIKMEINQQLEQRINIKFLVKLGKNGPEIHKMLQQVYGECALKERTVFKWVQCFQEGCEDPKDDARSGHPSTSSGNENIDRVRSLVLSDRRLTVKMIAEELGLGKSSIHTILREHLDMKKVCTKMYQNCSLLSKSCNGRSVALTGKPQRKAMNSWKRSSQVTNHGSTIMTTS